MQNSSLIWQKHLPIGSYEVYSVKPLNGISVKQVHGANVIHWRDAAKELLEADGIYWTWNDFDSEKLPTILTADCLPIIILGQHGGALLHAGWRGVKAKIYQHSSIVALQPNYYFIGPSIQQASFEVTSEFFDYFDNKSFFSNENNRCTFNLQQQTIFDLQQTYPGIRGEDCGLNTFTDNRFQSYRRDKKNRTNNYNIFNLNFKKGASS